MEERIAKELKWIIWLIKQINYKSLDWTFKVKQNKLIFCSLATFRFYYLFINLRNIYLIHNLTISAVFIICFNIWKKKRNLLLELFIWIFFIDNNNQYQMSIRRNRDDILKTVLKLERNLSIKTVNVSWSLSSIDKSHMNNIKKQ